MMRDTWRAVLVLLVILVVRHEDAVWQGARRALGPAVPPAVETAAPVNHQAWRPVAPAVPAAVAPVQGNGYHWPQVAPMPVPQQQIVIQQEERRPLRRVAAALTEVGDSLIGVVR